MFITLHQAHHELTVLAEILSGKEDMTRKLEIIRFVKLWLRIYLLMIYFCCTFHCKHLQFIRSFRNFFVHALEMLF